MWLANLLRVALELWQIILGNFFQGDCVCVLEHTARRMGPEALPGPVCLVAARDLNSRRRRRISHSRIAAALSASRCIRVSTQDTWKPPIARGGPDMGAEHAAGNFDIIKERMTRAQIAKAQALAAEWWEEHNN